MDLQATNRAYLPVKVDSLVDNSITDFNLYLRLENEAPILYSSGGYHWLRDELERLIGGGYKELLTEKVNQTKLKMYQEINHLGKVPKNLAPLERLKKIEQIGAAFTKCLHKGEITQSCVHKAREIASTLTETIQEQRQCIAALDQLVSHDEYVFHHSIRVAMYATAIALEMGLEDTTKLNEVAFGGIVHDIGKSKVPESIINKNGPLTDEEWKIMRSHPEIGHSFFEQTDMKQVPRDIIIHHHEKLDGSGYPHGLDKHSLMLEVQIVTLADIFDALTSVRSYQKSRSKFEALELIKHKMTGNHIDIEPFRALINCLAIPRSMKLA